MTTLREAAEQAVEALEWADNAMAEGEPIQVNTQRAIAALRAALAEPQVIYLYDDRPLHTAAPAAPQTLTNEQIKAIVRERFITGPNMQRERDWLFRSGGTPYNVWGNDLVWLVREVERAHGIGSKT